MMRYTPAWALLLVACGGGTIVVDGDPNRDDAGSADAGVADAGVDAADSNDPLAACDGTDPFGSEHCGSALDAWCRSHATERDCETSEVMDFGRPYVCAWAKITTFSDVATCAVESVVGRCQAYLVLNSFCSCTARPAANELTQNPCISSAGRITGPITRFTSLEVQRTEPRDRFRCGNFSPEPPEYCNCVQECSL